MNPEKEIEKVAQAVAALPVKYDMPYKLCWLQDKYVMQPKCIPAYTESTICILSSRQIIDGLTPTEWNQVAKKIVDFFIPKDKKKKVAAEKLDHGKGSETNGGAV